MLVIAGLVPVLDLEKQSAVRESMEAMDVAFENVGPDLIAVHSLAYNIHISGADARI